jgi:hypothetical protein
MHPDTYILDVNGNPVAEPNLERRREWSSCRQYRQRSTPKPGKGEANSVTGDDHRLALLKGRPLAHHRKDNPRARGPAEKQSGDK